MGNLRTLLTALLLGVTFTLMGFAQDVGKDAYKPVTADANLPDYLKDRGTGISTSKFGTYIRDKELVIYPYYEYYTNSHYEYSPKDWNYNQSTLYKGDFKASQELLFIGYGINKSLVLEIECALTNNGELTKAGNDTSNMPSKIKESGSLADSQVALRWRFMEENKSCPELTLFMENAFAGQKDKPIIGSSGEIVLGAAAIKGYNWGTLMLRAEEVYDREEKTSKFGEYAVEYLKKLSDTVRINAALEGESSDLSLIPELQYSIKPNTVFKFSLGLGLTSGADDFTPEIGLMFYF